MTTHTTRKLSKVCSEHSYNWLQQWINDNHSKGSYPGTPITYFYRNTGHRQYLSKFLESVIVKVLNRMGATVIKAPDAGKYRDTSKMVTDVVGITRKIGSGHWEKQSNVKKGRADVIAFFNNTMHNMEVKVGKDRMSPEQIKEKTRVEDNGEKYTAIKTVEDFIGLL